MAFQENLRLFGQIEPNGIYWDSLQIIQFYAGFGGISFTIGFVLCAFRLAFTYQPAARNRVWKQVAFTAAAAVVHYSA